MAHQKALLLGNGINFLGGSGASWEDVIRESTKFVGKPSIMSNWDQKALPLLYEELYSQHVGKKKQKEIDLKRFVAGQMERVVTNEFHKEVIQSNAINVITTNYDLALELGGSKKWQRKNLRRETKYSRYRRNKVDETFIWHMHGVCNAPNTIQLGHEHYSGQLQYLRGLVTSFGDAGYNKQKSAYLQGITNFDDVDTRHSWLDVFFRDNIHIVGLGLDFAEFDIWWAIAYKNRLKNGENREKKMDRGVMLRYGTTTYHVLDNAAESSKENTRLKILRSLGVRIKTHGNKSGYKGMYEDIIASI